ncbi:MAG: sensor histidine kinase [Clostridiales bacterium]|nr:sensor histidine kinase [Clostridiales bacterium]
MAAQKTTNNGRHRFGISARVTVMTLGFTVLITAVVLSISIAYLVTQTRQTSLQAAEYQLETAAATAAQRVEEVDELSNWCRVNTTVRAYMLTSVSIDLSTTLYSTVQNRYDSLSVSNYVQRLLLYSTSEQASTKFLMLGTTSAQSTVVTEEQLEALAEQDFGAWSTIVSDPLMLSGSSAASIPVTASTTGSYGNYTLHIYIGVSPTMITDVLEQFPLEEGVRLYWWMGDVLYQVEGDSLTVLQEEDLQMEEADGDDVATLDASTRLYYTELNGQRYSIVACPVGVHGMYVAAAIPDVPLSQMLPQLLRTLAIILFSVPFFGVLLMLFLHKLVSNPIRALQRQIETLAQGDFTVNPDIEWNHELGDVGRGINHLSENITALMDKRVEDEKKQLDLEYQVLQGQVNPHFLYNTLNSIRWMAAIQHAQGIEEMVTALSRLMKNVSKGNRRLVPLEQELSLDNDYFTIQRYRYGGTITIDVQCQVEEQVLKDCLIPPLSLQTLAENAIFHGIEPKGCAGQITVTIAPADEGADILVQMTDNGVGMSAEKIASVLQAEPETEENFRHVGISNVYRRIQYNFGPAYGLSLASVPGEGTTVTLRLPGSRQPTDGEGTDRIQSEQKQKNSMTEEQGGMAR